MRQSKYIINPGDVFERLIVLRKIKIKQKNRSVTKLECRCNCGNFTNQLPRDLIKKRNVSCGCYKAEISSTGKRLAYGEATLNKLFRDYKRGAKSRNLSFYLTIKQFKNFIEKSCYYCNEPPPLKNVYLDQNCSRRPGSINITKESVSNAWQKSNGIDRINNFRGYSIENCITSCTICNNMKKQLTQIEFLEHIKKISINRG